MPEKTNKMPANLIWAGRNETIIVAAAAIMVAGVSYSIGRLTGYWLIKKGYV